MTWAMPAESGRDALLVELAELHRARKTGRLVVARGHQILFVYLRQGQIAGVESESGPEAGGADPNEPVFLDGLDLEGDPGLARAAARERLLEALAWPEASCAFTEGGTAEGGDPPLELATEEVLAEAAQGVKDPTLIRAALGDLDRILGLSFDPSKPQNLTLTPTEGYILSRVDGTLSAREVLQLVPLESSETERGLFTLLIGGLIEYLPLPGRPAAKPEERATPRATSPPTPPTPEVPTPPRGQPSLSALSPEQREAQLQEIENAYRTKVGNRNHFEVLELERSADAAAVKAAYFRLAKRFHPDAYREAGMEDLHHKLKAVFVRLSEAKEVLGNPRKRGDYESTLPRRTFNPPRAEPPTAPSPSGPTPQPGPAWAEPPTGEEEAASRGDEALARAEAFMAEEKYWDVIQGLETNLGSLTGRRLQKARLLLARAFAKNPKWLRRAEEAAQKVTKDDPGNADAYLVLASVYRAGGLESRATAMYRKVLELQPQNKEAQEALAVTDPPPPTSTPLLKRFFRKS
jgi:tetratricopeptide (TPR) repeat protein